MGYLIKIIIFYSLIEEKKFSLFWCMLIDIKRILLKKGNNI